MLAIIVVTALCVGVPICICVLERVIVKAYDRSVIELNELNRSI